MSSPDYYKVLVGGTTFELPHRYHIIETLGVGSQGYCCSAYDTIDNRNVAIKKMRRPFLTTTEAKRAFREIKLMRMVNHPNVIKLLDLFSPQRDLEEFADVYIVMELMQADLQSAIRSDLTHEQISFLVYQMLCAVKHLHSAGIIHRDLKPSNLAVDESCHLKLIDFGLARGHKEDDFKSPYVVTRYYRSPEVILGLPYGPKIDVWSAGCILGEMVRGRPIFPGVNYRDQWFKIVQLLGNPPKEFVDRQRPELRDFINQSSQIYKSLKLEEFFSHWYCPNDSFMYEQLSTKNYLDLLTKMLTIDPEHRLSIDEALQHPYIKVWHRDDEVNVQPPHLYDGTDEPHNLTIQQWKELIFREVKDYESNVAMLRHYQRIPSQSLQ